MMKDSCQEIWRLSERMKKLLRREIPVHMDSARMKGRLGERRMCGYAPNNQQANGSHKKLKKMGNKRNLLFHRSTRNTRTYSRRKHQKGYPKEENGITKSKCYQASNKEKRHLTG